ncbi:MAG: bestrophin family ion channel [Candidatus Melainabacteria bacterium]|nr:bestrophin family ion channel [Candidatus Melainabacteria bacterium]
MQREKFRRCQQGAFIATSSSSACERILKTPLPLAYSIKIRRFIAIFLITLPLALIHEVGNNWLVPVLTMLVAYPLYSLDQLGVELQNPFNKSNLSHLPLDDICSNIERNVMALLPTNSDNAESNPQESEI